MSIFKVNQVQQFSKFERFTTGIFSVLLIILSILSGNLALIPLIVFAASLIFFNLIG